jgi:hypothetical protein
VRRKRKMNYGNGGKEITREADVGEKFIKVTFKQKLST